MRRFLLVDSFSGKELYSDDANEFLFVLFAAVCGMAKIIRVLNDDKRALTVFEICYGSKEYTL